MTSNVDFWIYRKRPSFFLHRKTIFESSNLPTLPEARASGSSMGLKYRSHGLKNTDFYRIILWFTKTQ
ncbi:hypothetical protein LEP1GSC193_0109 [Leptospira alstonii serovar Pingchang str. 80-412]|uniref:Uncharacterized protein n=2 Tax=Leptospira alstonii TaxID=28452 RepID=M6CX77_9LEPT|nr:hypothetical protein LEP1GSC194_1605 [Leptospira alstonii serovar Sichuan str. 79601]EQA79117.1 hypothetical protein LEP1GSC193_0109 [Leptospira alstonii serovar Pingchang str. 80-412]